MDLPGCSSSLIVRRTAPGPFNAKRQDGGGRKRCEPYRDLVRRVDTRCHKGRENGKAAFARPRRSRVCSEILRHRRLGAAKPRRELRRPETFSFIFKWLDQKSTENRRSAQKFCSVAGVVELDRARQCARGGFLLATACYARPEDGLSELDAFLYGE